MTDTREDLTFPSGSHGDTCAAWVYRPSSEQPSSEGPASTTTTPVVVMGHGLGGVRQMGLDPYARRFAAEGFIVVVFDYRFFGASSGMPRQLLSVRRQLEDWDAALVFARSLSQGPIAIWGSSFGGGHVLSVAAKHPELAAAIAQCPFTDGLASSLALGPVSLLKVAPRALADEVKALTGGTPVRVALAGPPHSAALMTAPDADPGYRRLVPEGSEIDFTVAARIGTRIGLYNPGRAAKRITVPLQVNVCLKDSVAPAKRTLKLLRKAPNADIREYDLGHFDIYVDGGFETVIEDQVAFLTTHLLS